MKDSIEEVLSLASELVSPSPTEEEKLMKIELRMRGLIEHSIERSKSAKPDVSLGGSYAKGTWLKGQADIDYFLLYPPDYSREELEGEGVRVALRAVKGFPVTMRYAEHPYVEAFFGNVRLNLVPCYKVERGRWQSAVDRSPFHTEYIKSHFDDKLRRETRLLKKFVMGAGSYGAEVKTRGFSGYMCEVLTLNYGSFESVLEALSTIQKEEIVSAEPYDSDVASAFMSPLVVLDPVDTTRNLGTAVSMENLGRLILKARAFLARPSISYFRAAGHERHPRQIDRGLLKSTAVVRFQNKPRSVDVLWGQLRKSLSSLSSRLGASGFKVLRAEAATNNHGKSAFAFLLLEDKIADYQVRSGPEIYRKEDLQRYIEKNRGRYLLSWISPEGRVLSLFKRDGESTDAVQFLHQLLSNPRDLNNLGLSKGIRNEIGRGFSISSGLKLFLSKNRSNGWLKDCVVSLVGGERAFEEQFASS